MTNHIANISQRKAAIVVGTAFVISLFLAIIVTSSSFW